ncbi:MAG: class I SAM-dependent methyltransferase [Clostridiales bacterium]|nr:class I SAM-dependent methyltransferase [Clostridiales bacterium]
MYVDFAQVYDRLMQDVDYTAWADYYVSLLSMAGISPGATVTECACGTGSLSLPFSERYTLTGLDISQEMLSIAADKLRRHGKNVPLIRQDMQKLSLIKKQDAILATCDGVNYLRDKRSLQKFFTSTLMHLKPGGVLCFDISSVHKLRHTLGNNTLSHTQGDVHYIWYNDWHEAKHLLQMELHLYVKESQGHWRYLVEHQVQRAWSADELRAELELAGFDAITIFGDRTFVLPDEQTQRLHISALKKTQ